MYSIRRNLDGAYFCAEPQGDFTPSLHVPVTEEHPPTDEELAEKYGVDLNNRERSYPAYTINGKHTPAGKYDVIEWLRATGEPNVVGIVGWKTIPERQPAMWIVGDTFCQLLGPEHYEIVEY